MVWRGPMVTQALEQLLDETNWRDLDYLIVDMPPGTGDIQLTLAQKVPVTGAVIVTTPQDIALLDARKGLKMFEKVGVPIARHRREHEHAHLLELRPRRAHLRRAAAARRCAADYDVPFLGALPLDIRIREQADERHADGGRRSRRRRSRAIYRDDRPRGRGELAARRPRTSRPHIVSEASSVEGPGPMSIKSDRWIRRMAAEHGMIEPFEPGQVREVDGDTIVSYGTSSYGYDVRCAREFKIFTNINSTIVDPKNFDERVFVDIQRRRLHHPAELVRARAHGRVLPHPAQRAHDLPRQVDLRALRHHRQRDAARAGMGGPRHARVLEHHAAAREDLRQRRRRADAVLRVRRGLRDVATRTAAASTRASRA